jgi:hypothetical protein
MFGFHLLSISAQWANPPLSSTIQWWICTKDGRDECVTLLKRKRNNSQYIVNLIRWQKNQVAQVKGENRVYPIYLTLA